MRITGLCEGPSKQCKEIESIRLPVVDKKAARGTSVEVFPLVHPHRILSYLADHVGVAMPTSEVERYWDHAREMNEPWACSHTATRQHIPIGLHGDAARLWTQFQVERLVGVWMNLVLFRPRSVRYSRFLLFAIPKEKLVKNRTLNAFWKRMVWSLNAAFTGYNPSTGPSNGPLTGKDAERAGTPLCQGMRRFAVTELRGDWEWHRDIWRFTASWQSQQVCFRCPAVTNGMGDPSYVYYNNDAHTSCWLQEEFTLPQFIARRLKERQLCGSAITLDSCTFSAERASLQHMFWNIASSCLKKHMDGNSTKNRSLGDSF